jgi:hypothetical protein
MNRLFSFIWGVFDKFVALSAVFDKLKIVSLSSFDYRGR